MTLILFCLLFIVSCSHNILTKMQEINSGLLSGLCRILPRFRSLDWISIHSSMHVTWMLWPCVGSGVERRDLLMAGCHIRRLNQALSFLLA